MLWFPGPKSETGEDMAELQVHGGRAIVARGCSRCWGGSKDFRLAEPGEFTRRAFENGRLDLTAVEGLADLIDAETEAQRRQALRQFKGLLGNRAETWRGRLIEALALVEAGIDFSDEGDVPEDLIGAGPGDHWPAGERDPGKRPAPGRASGCAKVCGSPSRGRPMWASRRCSTGWPGATPRSCRPMPAPPAT